MDFSNNNNDSSGVASNAATTYASLAPTQVMSNNRRRQRGANNPPHQPGKPRTEAPAPQPEENGVGVGSAAATATALNPDSNKTNSKRNSKQQRTNQHQQELKEEPSSGPTKNHQQTRNRRRNRNNRVAAQPNPNQQRADDRQSKRHSKSPPPKSNDGIGNDNGKDNNVSNNQKKGKARRNKKNKSKFPWRRHIPPGTVDPITLEPLISLPYPPFALVATPPYDPVLEWPVPPPDKLQQQQTKKLIDIEAVNRKRIEEQWGDKIAATATGSDAEQYTEKPKEKVSDPDAPRHYHLYDGRALAFYLVSQLQFIDPLNRRDLTRAELVGLDQYLTRYGNDRLKVVDAYDAKGITLSSAGAAAHTAQGRAEVLQQTARNLLNALFGRSGVTSAPSPPPAPVPVPMPNRHENSLQEQYAQIQRMEQDRARMQEERSRNNVGAAGFGNYSSDHGVYGSFGGGLMVIDDDENPELRGDASPTTVGATRQAVADEFPPIGNSNSSGGGMFFSSRYPHPASTTSGGESFPILSASALHNRDTDAGLASAPPAAVSSISEPSTQKVVASKSSKPSKTLSRITGAVKKTSQAERQRQWEAREAARKKALLSNLSFGVDPSQRQEQPRLLSAPMMAVPAEISEEQLERNRLLAEALGVIPATLRQSYGAGWARPAAGEEFGDELDFTIYSNSLITKIREGSHLPLVLKLEKKWNAFLSDPTAPSLSLYPMDRVSRSIVHEYAESYRLKTESFDPEPKRYVHCIKTLDTRAPRPLLSVVVRTWKTGPTTITIPPSPLTVDNTRTVDGFVLPIRPRGEITMELAEFTATSTRPNLELDPLPAAATTTSVEDDKDKEEFNLLQRRFAREQAAAEKRRQQQAEKERALRAAFDDGSDDDFGNNKQVNYRGSDDSDSDESSAWGDPERLLVAVDNDDDDTLEVN